MSDPIDAESRQPPATVHADGGSNRLVGLLILTMLVLAAWYLFVGPGAGAASERRAARAGDLGSGPSATSPRDGAR